MRRAAPAVVAGTGAVLVVLGVALLLRADIRYDGAVGWVAYGSEGVEQAMARADRRFWVEAGDSALLGALLFVAGLLVIAVLAGWLLGRRRGASPPRARPR